MAYKIITDISTEPITLAEAKLHLRVLTGTSEDAVIQALIVAAREYCEQYTGRAFGTKTLELILDAFPVGDSIYLPCPPLQSVASAKYTDKDGVEATMPETDYIVDSDSTIGRIVRVNSWPSFIPYASNPIKIRYTAGYTAPPKTLKQAMLLLIGHWYNNRESSTDAGKLNQLDFSVRALLSQYRVRWWD